MIGNMAAFLNTQMDFVFFFYGLAFILFGAVSFAIGRGERQESWGMLGLFGAVHGASEWLDLIALVVGDVPAFAVSRTVIMAVSYVFLLEFARLEAIRFEWRMPGPWIFVPLFGCVILGVILGGVTVSNVVARYALGFPGAMATSLIFLRHARTLSGADKKLALSLAVGFGLYAVAAGAITPATPFWPASVLNYPWFTRSTGIPIQLIRGLLACWMALSIWLIWGQKLTAAMASQRYTHSIRKQFAWTLALMATILMSGWMLTQYLGEIYNENVRADSIGDLDLFSSRLDGKTAILDGMAQLVAGEPSVQALVEGAGPSGGSRVLDLALKISGAERMAILDGTGRVVAATGVASSRPEGHAAHASSFQNGEVERQFAYEAATGRLQYYTNYPIRDASGTIAGAAVINKPLLAFEANLSSYEGVHLLLDPDGVIVLTNRPEYLLRPMWPLSAETQTAWVAKWGPLRGRALMTQEVHDSAWVVVDGERDYVRRRFVEGSTWSLAVLKLPAKIYASRLLGIAITLLTTIVALVYLLARERALHDSVQMDKRLQLQELASDLRFQATTDPLTGLNNRLRFNEAAALEIARSRRYGTALSLVLYDVDHFKQVNDTYGHLAGDQVLIELSRFVASRIRNVDVLARWGGEEFAILLPESQGETAYQLAVQLRDAIRDAVFDEVGSVTCSFGVAQLEREENEQMLVSRADAALYQAKIAGRNEVVLASRRGVTKPGIGSAA
jgi:diguanylate cyclase (GGDEF)-like protein